MILIVIDFNLRIGPHVQIPGYAPGAEVFPCLEELIIEDCNVLTSVPCHFPSLQKLKIMKVIKTAIEKIRNLTTLKSRHISNLL